MTNLSTATLSQNTMTSLISAGWAKEPHEVGRQQSDLLRSAGIPVGSKGRQLLDELGGLTIDVAVEVEVTAEGSEGTKHTSKQGGIGGWLRRQLFAHSTPHAEAPSSITVNRSLSFVAADILEAVGCQCSVLLEDVAYTSGRVMSVIGTDKSDRFVLVDEQSEAAFVLDVLAENVAVFDSFESALEALLRTRPWTSENLRFEFAPDDFQVDPAALSEFIGAGSGECRFRIQRKASHFPDRCIVEMAVLPDGAVNGIVRDTQKDGSCVDVHFRINDADLGALRESFAEASSTTADPSINIGYGEFGRSFNVKNLVPPNHEAFAADNLALWEQLTAICEKAIRIARTDRK